MVVHLLLLFMSEYIVPSYMDKRLKMGKRLCKYYLVREAGPVVDGSGVEGVTASSFHCIFLSQCSRMSTCGGVLVTFKT